MELKTGLTENVSNASERKSTNVHTLINETVRDLGVMCGGVNPHNPHTVIFYILPEEKHLNLLGNYINIQNKLISMLRASHKEDKTDLQKLSTEILKRLNANESIRAALNKEHIMKIKLVPYSKDDPNRPQIIQGLYLRKTK